MIVVFGAVVYACALVCIGGCVARAVRYARAPLHLRWELYPVPHGLWAELKFMVPEMVFLKGLWEFNRKLWLRSFPFHFGLYLLIGAAVLMAFGAALSPVYAVMGAAGAALTVLGALALLARRLTDRTYTVPADIFNLVFFIAAISITAAGYLLAPAGLTLRAVARGILTFDTSLAIPPLLGAGIMLCALLAAYIPMTHMSHFIAKYFTYHSVRWDDAPPMRKKIAEYLAYRPAWSAQHVGEGKTWAEIASK